MQQTEESHVDAMISSTNCSFRSQWAMLVVFGQTMELSK